ncbi:hypothetical protein BO94DRAFT_613671 [Aspergillus sclerotioniger CBS 115572]|uniref:Concanavalin A-like lectin/glucanase n=1 Tax=Aspergillus sclerotioniger CBS 115572 TaxID=1450535 RepID=A0A317V0Z4_9EURO|nr:hypothetical protein BO94DRAFT_613671 [Aspergillus sclerotioniger CBS 115572]PWY66487.1 hypothetical protein BO94DRAFT_613671 [Aspergillus sclerotioniger CBS 115572]
MHVLSTLSTLAILPSALGAVLPAALQSTTKLTKRDSWGGSVSLGPTTSDIINAVTTIIPGVAPSTQNGELFLWPGMSNGTGDLIQTTLESWPSNAWCGATTGQWCVRASIFGSFGQLDGTGSPVSADDHVRIEYNLASDGETWTQNVTNALTGAALSSYSYAAGPYMTGYGTGTECDSDCTGTVASQLYINTTITLREADTSFGDTIATGAGATYTGLTSSEGGKVWKIATISIPAMGSETAVASSTSEATHATPTPTTAVVVEETSSVATSTAQETGAAETGAKTGFRSGAGSGSGSFSGFGAGFPSSGEDCSEQ